MTLDEWREKKGIRSRDLAKSLGLSQSYVSEICSGKKPVTVAVARKIESVTGRAWHKWMSEGVQ